MKTAVSLFSGCGGSDLGLIDAGFNIVFANDINKYAKETYLINLPETDYQCTNIKQVRSFPKADLLIGCYPCQGFSQGGARDADRKINYLYQDFNKALRTINPKAFIIENVQGMYRSNNKYLLNDQLKVFSESGYNVRHKLLNAADFGVAQNRKRIFIVGIHTDIGLEYHFPKPTYGSGNLCPYKTIKQALKNMPTWPEGDFLDMDFHWYYLSRNRWRNWSDPSLTIVSNARHMPLHPISPKLVYISPDKWVWSDKSKRKRRFSYKEAALLQGFDKNMIFPDTAGLMKKYNVIGNAVPPALFKAVANELPNIW